MNKKALFNNNYKTVGIIAYSIICVVIVFQIITTDYFYHDYQSGEFFEQSNDTLYTYELIPGEMHIRQVFKPQYFGLKQISFRIENSDINRMNGDLKVEIYHFDDLVFQQLIDVSEIEDWLYYTLDIKEANLRKGAKYTLDISCPTGKDTYPYRLYLSEKKLKENISLSYNTEAVNEELDITYLYHVYEIWTAIGLIIVLIVTLLILIYYSQIRKIVDKIDYRIRIAVSLIIQVTVNVLLVQYVIFGEAYYKSIPIMMINAVIILCIDSLLYLISHNLMISCISCNIFVALLGILNHYIKQFRGSVIIPADIVSINTAISVAKNYVIKADREIIVAIVLFPLLSIITVCLQTNIKQIKRSYIAVLFAVSFTGLFVLSSSRTLQRKLVISVNLWAQNESSHDNGYLLNFLENIQYTIVRKPEGYTVEKVEEILENTPAVLSATEEPADNIIIIMNESFADLNYLGEIDTNMEVLDKFYKLAQEKNAKAGKCVSPVFGGGTSCTEFECLTGCSMIFLEAGVAPYQQYVHTPVESAAQESKDKGYDTVAVHLADPANWNRKNTYPLLGFNDFISSESAEYENATFCRYWTDDKSIYNVLYNETNDVDTPLFEFGITMQLHGGYSYSESDFETTVKVNNIENGKDELEQYLTLLDATEESFSELIDELRTSKERTIVFLFGDHLPGLPNSFYEELTGKSDRGIEFYETPYIVWANYDVDFSDLPDIISTNFLSPYIMKYAGIDLNGYFGYLYTLSQKYPVVSRNGIRDADGNALNYDKESSCYNDLHSYEMLQYALLNGEDFGMEQ